MKHIQIGKTRHAMVDDGDAVRLRKFNWTYSKGYAIRRVIPDRGGTTISLQREVMGLTFFDGKEVRCMNGDKLDCRKDNLFVRQSKRSVK